MKATRAVLIATMLPHTMLPRETSLESPTSSSVRCPASSLSAVIAPTTWATSPAPPS